MSATRGQTILALNRTWYHTSAQDRVLGKLASRIAWVLMGKHKPTYEPAGVLSLSHRVAVLCVTPSRGYSIQAISFRAYSLMTLTVDAGDYVIVSDALGVRLTGKKGTDKVYFHHSGYMSGLKEVPITRMRERYPEEIIRRAVSGMLPKNTHRQRRMDRLKVYPGEAPASLMANVLKTWRDQTELGTGQGGGGRAVALPGGQGSGELLAR